MKSNHEIYRKSQYEIDRENHRRLERQNEANRMRRFSGPYTGRCPNCYSTDLWDDNHACGCNRCDWMYIANL